MSEQPEQPQYEQPQYEYEKYEKEEEKREKETEKEEKTWEEKWRRDPLGAAVWAAILIWAGLVLLVQNMGLLANLTIGDTSVEAWPIILIGAGLILLLEVAVRVLVPSYRRPVGGSIIFAVIVVGIGLGDLFGWTVVWPLILIAIGVGMLLRGLIRVL
jgi:hypothetical protein